MIVSNASTRLEAGNEGCASPPCLLETSTHGSLSFLPCFPDGFLLRWILSEGSSVRIILGLPLYAAMSLPGTLEISNIALITIVCGWVFTAVATLAIVLQIWSAVFEHNIFGSSHCMLLAAFGTAIALVSQTTWAIIDEDSVKHVGQVPSTHKSAITKVRLP